MSQTVCFTLPDQSIRELPAGSTLMDLARAVGPGLAKAAVAAVVDGDVRDLMYVPARDANVRVLTPGDPESLPVLRHSVAHVLATAVRELRPNAAIGFGPPIDDGFYYDFGVEAPFTPEDLAAFEERMHAVVEADMPFERCVVTREEARNLFAGDPLKLERLEELGPEEEITVYRNGPFLDLCRGPHVPSTGRIQHFKLLHGAGAYWRGDERRQMLQRIYGTAFWKATDLAEHLTRLENAKRRDHRRLGRELDLFQFHPVSPGAAFWTPRGTTLYNLLIDFMRERQRADFLEIRTPLLYTKTLWEQSGHWGKYRENMFLVLNRESGEHDMSLKPMNCPSHHIYYSTSHHSYRALPLRYVTFDVLQRYELSGTLAGLTRVRQFAQDDCHVYLREDQIADEVRFLMDFILAYYETFGLAATLKFATRPERRIGDDATWDRAEAALRAGLEATDRSYELKEGEGAFYGPKIDFDVTDSLGRAWQLGTIQLDYAAAERFSLSYVGDDNAVHRPVVIHRAVCGSFERFIAILIEHFGGAFPLWLAPEQVRVLPISEHQLESAASFVTQLEVARIRATLDDRDTLSYRIREAELLKVPYMAVVGEREATAGTVAVRHRGAARKQEVMGREEFIARLVEEISTRRLD